MIFILTGAGISRESGLATFRDKDGLWNKVRIEDVATPEAFYKNPEKIYEFYNFRRKELIKTVPNPAHLALANLERNYQYGVFLVTQNVDDLHEKAGSKKVLHMHGKLLSALCAKCGDSRDWTTDLSSEDACPNCGRKGTLRPNVVWFGETPYHLDEIDIAIRGCSIFVSIGTSGVVYPAAGLVQIAKSHGAATFELNLEPSANLDYFDQGFYGPASQIVPAWVEKILKNEVF
ncbi:MAG: NAD-dependent deacylase [Deltaproteobacteria bacterium]|jgi:NAD-dependent deacetylase|nr:NAD-dependent deacylase [Deltaproteobacteria bacterium]